MYTKFIRIVLKKALSSNGHCTGSGGNGHCY